MEAYKRVSSNSIFEWSQISSTGFKCKQIDSFEPQRPKDKIDILIK